MEPSAAARRRTAWPILSPGGWATTRRAIAAATAAAMLFGTTPVVSAQGKQQEEEARDAVESLGFRVELPSGASVQVYPTTRNNLHRAAQLPYGLPLRLPPDIMFDKYVDQLERRLEAKQYESALLFMDDIAALLTRNGRFLPAEFHFAYGQVANLAIEKEVRRRGAIDPQDYRRLSEVAIYALERYVTLAGPAGEHYTEALMMLDGLEIDTPWRRP